MNQPLEGKVAVVTGGAGGIGAAVVARLVAQGARVAVFDLDAARAAAVPGASLGRGVDVADYAAVERAVGEAEAALGSVDLLVNVAGGGLPHTIGGTSPEDWSRIVGANLDGPFHCIKACAGPMRRRGGGAIVTVASLAALTMSMNFSASYTASKSGVLGLTRHAAFELASDGIRVNAVLPGPVLTPLMRQASNEALASVPRMVPMGRWIEPEEVADAVLFFCLPMSSGCTGTHVIVDGGLHVGNPTGSRETYFASRDRA